MFLQSPLKVPPQGCKATSREHPLSSQEVVVVILSTSNGWKAEPTLELCSGFEPKVLRLVIQCPNH